MVSQSPAVTTTLTNNDYEINKIDKNGTDQSPPHFNITSLRRTDGGTEAICVELILDLGWQSGEACGR